MFTSGFETVTRLRSLIAICLLVAINCGAAAVSPDQRQREIAQSKYAAQEYAAAARQADNNDPAGFARLFEIATNDVKYTVEYSEVAQEKIYLLLYWKTELWVKTFSKIDLKKFKEFVKGIEVSRLPKGVVSDEQFKETIFRKLKSMKVDKKEKELVDHIFGLYENEPVKK